MKPNTETQPILNEVAKKAHDLLHDFGQASSDDVTKPSFCELIGNTKYLFIDESIHKDSHEIELRLIDDQDSYRRNSLGAISVKLHIEESDADQLNVSDVFATKVVKSDNKRRTTNNKGQFMKKDETTKVVMLLDEWLDDAREEMQS